VNFLCAPQKEFQRRPLRLLVVAPPARSHNVAQFVIATARQRDHMIHRERIAKKSLAVRATPALDFNYALPLGRRNAADCGGLACAILAFGANFRKRNELSSHEGNINDCTPPCNALQPKVTQ
jgi:hypothetical protein